MIKPFEKSDDSNQVKALLKEAFAQAYATKKALDEEVEEFLAPDYIALIDIENGEIKGLVGAKAQYGNTGYELHPLVVKKSWRNQGIGKRLLKALEKHLKHLGCIILYLGSDDEHNQTSLSQSDIYQNPLAALKAIKNLDHHPYSFYLKQGYKLLGVIPDANGFNKPDIIMGKRLSKKKGDSHE